MDVGDPVERAQHFALNSIGVCGVGAQAQLLPVATVQLEPALRAVRDGLGQPQLPFTVPFNFKACKAFTNGVRGVKDHILQIWDGLHQLAQLLGIALFQSAAVVGRHDLPIDNAGAAALAHLAGNVAVLFFHVFKQVELGREVTLLGCIQNLRQAAGGQSTCGVALQLALQMAQLGGLWGADAVHLNRLAIGPQNHAFCHVGTS